jgi:hypothetical protein
VIPAKPMVVALPLTLLALQARADDVEPPRKGLTAQIVVKSKLPLETSELEWELVLTNEGKSPVRICTLCNGCGGGWKGSYDQTFDPDFWKSGRPRDEEFGKHVVTLKAEESVSLRQLLGGDRGEKYTITAAYQVGKKFAARHKVWEGKVEAKPVVIRAIKLENAKDGDGLRLRCPGVGCPRKSGHLLGSEASRK